MIAYDQTTFDLIARNLRDCCGKPLRAGARHSMITDDYIFEVECEECRKVRDFAYSQVVALESRIGLLGMWYKDLEEAGLLRDVVKKHSTGFLHE